MRIIGSGRIDDYKKVSLEDTVLKAIDAKPGDSILFYERHNDDSVCIYKAEGARITNEADAPRRRHMREAFVRMRLFLMITVVVVIARIVMTVFNYELLGTWRFAITIALGFLTLLFVLACINLSRVVDNPFDHQALVTIGNVYAKNRLTGVSKISTDGYIATGNMYINSLFGAKVDDVEVIVHPDGQDAFAAVTTLIKSVPGYCVYKLHIKDELPASGYMEVKTIYKYLGKRITVNSLFQITYDQESKDVVTSEGEIKASIEFDQLNTTVFDEGWMKESDDMY